MKFIKSENVFFNRKDLEMAIKSLTDNPKEEYKISIRNSYPCFCIGHEHYYVHRVLGELYFGDLTGYSIHHINGEKMDNTKENLQKITNAEHSKLHHAGRDFRSEEGKWKSVNSAREKRYKKEISKEEIEKLLSQGKTKYEIARNFQCGVNTIYRRLGYKF